jgi:hypothetical protein
LYCFNLFQVVKTVETLTPVSSITLTLILLSVV